MCDNGESAKNEWRRRRDMQKIADAFVELEKGHVWILRLPAAILDDQPRISWRSGAAG
jgi:hypothetical protein